MTKSHSKESQVTDPKTYWPVYIAESKQYGRILGEGTEENILAYEKDGEMIAQRTHKLKEEPSVWKKDKFFETFEQLPEEPEVFYPDE